MDDLAIRRRKLDAWVRAGRCHGEVGDPVGVDEAADYAHGRRVLDVRVKGNSATRSTLVSISMAFVVVRVVAAGVVLRQSQNGWCQTSCGENGDRREGLHDERIVVSVNFASVKSVLEYTKEKIQQLVLDIERGTRMTRVLGDAETR